MSEEHTALYRRHRPSAFEQIAGQDRAVSAIGRAVAAGTPHHAYLLTGPRGTGKTTTARLIAAGLNCEHGPTDSPCGVCSNCTTIAKGHNMDVQEIDAATFNGVDNIRELRERVGTIAAFGGWRVYILDEAHMLSKAAWNALLKTLEEPPPSTVFILCTTEARSVPATVISRCQHHVFKPGTIVQIKDLLLSVAAAEGFELDEQAAQLIAKSGKGSYRDSLTVLDQVLASLDSTAPNSTVVDLAVARAGLASSEEEGMFALLTAIGQGNSKQSFAQATVLGAASEPEAVLRELENLVREILIVAVFGNLPASMKTGTERDQELIDAAKLLEAPGAARLADEISAAFIAIKAGADSRLRLEMACLRSAAPYLRDMDKEIAGRLDSIEATSLANMKSRRPVSERK